MTAAEPGETRMRLPVRGWVLPLLAVSAVILAIAAAVIASIYRDFRIEESGRLGLVAQLRSSQVHNWLDDHLSQVRHTADGPAGALYRRWRDLGDAEPARERLLTHLHVLGEAAGGRAFVVAEDGSVLSSAEQPPPARDYAATVQRALALDQPLFSDPVRGPAGQLWLDFVAPIGRSEDRAHGALVLRVNAASFIVPLLARWPTAGVPGRLSLIHDEGRLLAGGGGTPDEGALTAAVAVPGAPWMLLVEVPREVVDLHAREQAVWVAGLALMSVAAAGVLLYLLRQRQVLHEQHEQLQSMRLLQAVANGSRDMIYVKDLEGRYLLFNAEACRVTGKRPEEVIGRGMEGLFPPELAAQFRRDDEEVLASGAPCRQSRQVETVDGPRVFQSIKAPLRDEAGRIVGTFGISRDVTELKLHRDHLEELVRARTLEVERTNRALQSAVDELQAFSYTVSHDLRAPLQAIAGFAGALAEGEAERLSDTGRHRLERIVQAARRMDGMIGDILACSRADRAQLQSAVVDLHALARDVTGELAAQYPATRVEIAPLPPVHGDPVLLRQVLANLVGNAFKFSARAPAPQVVVEAQHEAGQVQVRVRDNGAGFDPAYAHKLFALFQRLHKDSEFAGTGVGLAIVKRVIARHGGQVAAESVPGGWTTFSFTLPAV